MKMELPDKLKEILSWGQRQTEANAEITKQILQKLDSIEKKLDNLGDKNGK